jgi:hypothetical protein
MLRLSSLTAAHAATKPIGVSTARRFFSLAKKDSQPIKELEPVTYYLGVPQNGKLSQLRWRDRLVIYLVFSLTGTTAVMIVKPTLAYFCEEGFWGLKKGDGFVKGPWQFRVLYFAVMWPTYTVLLIVFGAIFHRYQWFAQMAHKMWSRVLPKPVANLMGRVLIQREKQRSTVGWTTGYRPGTKEAAASSAAAEAALAMKAIPSGTEEIPTGAAAEAVQPPQPTVSTAYDADPWIVDPNKTK